MIMSVDLFDLVSYSGDLNVRCEAQLTLILCDIYFQHEHAEAKLLL